MKKEDLLKSASLLKVPGSKSVKEFSEKKDIIIKHVNDRMRSRKDINELIGEKNLEMMNDNHNNQMRFMISIFEHYNPEVYIDTILWVFRTYRSHGFNLAYWPALLNTFAGVLQDKLSQEAYEEIYPFYNWMIINNPSFVEISDK